MKSVQFTINLLEWHLIPVYDNRSSHFGYTTWLCFSLEWSKEEKN